MPRGQTLWERVWLKVEIPDPAGLYTQCWRWRGALSQKRGGRHRPVIQLGKRGSKIVVVARLVCEWQHGPPPTPEHEAGHTCPDGELSLCVSPHHLRWMTREENEQHKWAMRRRVVDYAGEEEQADGSPLTVPPDFA